MKFFYKKVINFVFLLILVLIGTKVVSQKLVTINVKNNYFDQTSVTINVGDTVKWINSSGSHNVNGTKTTYSTNPVGFGNSVSTNWEFIFVFNTLGTYNYQCDPHVAAGMKGKIIVSAKTGIPYKTISNRNIFMSSYPRLTRNLVTFEFLDKFIYRYKGLYINIFNMKGVKIEKSNIINDNIIEFSILEWKKGVYIYQVISGSTLLKTGKIVKMY